ncbi:MAG TPA: hypothetical protein VM183_09575 [Burkholderiales bacterium]|nr:hypothetical protein [Burkholderiales bacterium]
MAKDGTDAARRLELDAEPVPLAVAARVAYFQLTDAVRQVSSEDDLAEVVHLVAIALSTVAPIRHASGGILTDRELRELFYRPLGLVGKKPSLEGFVIRRGELKSAMTTLKEARIVFGPQ